jgi:hypothetical protein
MSADKSGGTRDQPPMTHPHHGHGPATSPTGAGRGCSPGPAELGVPVSIWPGLPALAAGHSPEACPGPVTAATAARAVAAFSRPGDLVAAPDGSLAVIEAAAAAGRRVLGLIPAGGRAVAGLPAGVDPAARPLARLRPGGPGRLLAPGDPDAGQAALAITGCHGPGCCSPPEPGGADGLALVFAACQRVLAPDGVLAVITASRADGGQLADLAGHAVAAARAAGLVYAQHIVLVHAAIDGDHFVPGPAATAPASWAGGTQIHSDLLVFTKP